jgi:hypothetical protein
MARHESDREDLIAEATALKERVEFQVPDSLEPIVAGFHGDGRLSIYFGPDPVYHFDPEGRLRRAFVDGNLYRSRGDTLSRLTRERAVTTTSLLRHDLSPEELSTFLSAMGDRIQGLEQAFDRQAVVVIRQVPAESDVIGRVRQALRSLSAGELAPALKK